MIKTVVTCDMCGNEIEGSVFFDTTFKGATLIGLTPNSPTKFILCTSCKERVNWFITRYKDNLVGSLDESPS